jgi:hypothetical protein
MSKLKNIIKQLSEKDYLNMIETLKDNGADKTATLLKFLKEKQLTDAKIMTELEVNSNAYYTLRSRLNEKIEDYLVKQMESPRTDILRKVASINEMVFTKKKTIVVATLKKLEKELTDYDLSNELIVVYKHLKKYNLNTAEHFHYSQLYNKHVAYTLALDKSEDIIAEYFIRFGSYYLTGEETLKTELVLLFNEVNNIARLYQSHRLYVYVNCVSIFHKIYVDPELQDDDTDDSIEFTFGKIDEIMTNYAPDANYHHLSLVFDYLKMLYFENKKLNKKALKYYGDVNEFASVFISNYSLFTFTPLYFVTKLVKDKIENPKLVLENHKHLFDGYESDVTDFPKHIIYEIYESICYFNTGKLDVSIKNCYQLLNLAQLKRYNEILIEIKTFLALQYCLVNDIDLFNQIMTSIQRQIRISDKSNFEYIAHICKIMKVSLSNLDAKNKLIKIKVINAKIDLTEIKRFSIFKYILFEDELLTKLTE